MLLLGENFASLLLLLLFRVTNRTRERRAKRPKKLFCLLTVITRMKHTLILFKVQKYDASFINDLSKCPYISIGGCPIIRINIIYITSGNIEKKVEIKAEI